MLTEYERLWQDTKEINQFFKERFTLKVNSMPLLYAHRDYIEQYDYGFGERPFHYLWYLLVRSMPHQFNFLDIGVYMGQVTTLVQLIAKYEKLTCQVYAVSPFSSAGDIYSSYMQRDYYKAVQRLHAMFELDFSKVVCLKGFSTDEKIKKQVQEHTYDLIYVDGAHDYISVCSDITMAISCLTVGGYIVTDDSSLSLQMPDDCFKGHPETSAAVEDTLGKDERFKHVFACGHNRVWRKIYV